MVVEKIRFCLCRYLSIDYVVKNGARKVRIIDPELNFEKDMFSE